MLGRWNKWIITPRVATREEYSVNIRSGKGLREIFVKAMCLKVGNSARLKRGVTLRGGASWGVESGQVLSCEDVFGIDLQCARER